jgi:hypothetical protein
MSDMKPLDPKTWMLVMGRIPSPQGERPEVHVARAILLSLEQLKKKDRAEELANALEAWGAIHVELYKDSQ